MHLLTSTLLLRCRLSFLVTNFYSLGSAALLAGDQLPAVNEILSQGTIILCLNLTRGAFNKGKGNMWQLRMFPGFIWFTPVMDGNINSGKLLLNCLFPSRPLHMGRWGRSRPVVHTAVCPRYRRIWDHIHPPFSPQASWWGLESDEVVARVMP